MKMWFLLREIRSNPSNFYDRALPRGNEKPSDTEAMITRVTGSTSYLGIILETTAASAKVTASYSLKNLPFRSRTTGSIAHDINKPSPRHRATAQMCPPHLCIESRDEIDPAMPIH